MKGQVECDGGNLDPPLVVLPLRTSPLVVQFYGPPRLQSNTHDPPATNLPTRSISQYRNLPASIPTREYQDMILFAHIITCSPPSINLPAHRTTSSDPSLTSQHQNEIKKSTLHYTRYILKLVSGIPMLPRTCLLVVQLYEPPRSQSNSTDLPIRSPTHVIHQLRTSPLATSLKCEHETYEPPCSYPHTRALGYEPPCSYHHVFITNHEPTCS